MEGAPFECTMLVTAPETLDELTSMGRVREVFRFDRPCPLSDRDLAREYAELAQHHTLHLVVNIWTAEIFSLVADIRTEAQVGGRTHRLQLSTLLNPETIIPIDHRTLKREGEIEPAPQAAQPTQAHSDQTDADQPDVNPTDVPESGDTDDLFDDMTSEPAYPGVAIHVRGGREVEMFAKGDLFKAYDGFGWEVTPHQDIRNIIAYFMDPDGSSIGLPSLQGEVDGLVNKLVSALCVLKDARKSSIVGLVDNTTGPDGSERADHAAVTQWTADLRPYLDFDQPGRWIDLNEISVEVLVGLLQLDGAHFINRKGQLWKIAQRIKDAPDKPVAAKETDNGQQEAEVQDQPNQHAGRGTGIGAMVRLARMLTDSFLIKVSANGYFKTLPEDRKPRTQWS